MTSEMQQGTNRIESAPQPIWQRLGEIDLEVCSDDAGRATVREDVRRALMQSVTGFGALAEMQTPLENAVLDAMARKDGNRPGCAGQRLLISCLRQRDDESARVAADWSFFVIERPAAAHDGGMIEVIELCLYHE